MEPVVKNLAERYSGKMEFEEIDTYEDPEKAMEFEIQYVQTFVILDAEGNEVDRITGKVPESELVDAIEKAIQ